MHTKPMRESEGAFKDPWELLPDRRCPKCGVTGQVFHRTWESSCGGYEDDQYECRACKKVWWVDGPDS